MILLRFAAALFKKSYFILPLMAISCLYAENDGYFFHKPLDTQFPSCIANYRLVDLGETDLSQKQLTKLGQFDSLGPSINRKGQITFNTLNGGFLREPRHGETGLSFDGVKVFARALNDKGEIVASIHRPDKSIEWALWTARCGQSSRTHIANYTENDWKLLFTGLSNDGLAIGYRTLDNLLEPITWSKCNPQINRLGADANKSLQGFAISVNRQGSILGYFDDQVDVHPFIFDSCKNLFIFRNFRNYLCCEGWVEPADMVLSDSGTLIGTYWLKYIGKDEDPSKLGHYFAYRWNPYETRAEKIFERLELNDMRIAALNSADMLVGSQNNRAALSTSLREPIDLNLTVNAPEWVLMEATGINDSNEIVGYGTKNGKMHLFHLVPIY